MLLTITVLIFISLLIVKKYNSVERMYKIYYIVVSSVYNVYPLVLS